MSAIAFPLVPAKSPASSCPCNLGLPGGPGLVPAAKTVPTSYIGHPGGPGGVGPVLVTAPEVQPRGGFHWSDAAVGGGFVAGLVLLGAGAAAMIRRRGILAAQQ